MTTSDSRERFEKWAAGRNYRLSPDMNNCGIVVPERYGHRVVQVAWEAWQAALSHQAPAVAVSELEELARGDAGWTYCFGDDEYFVRHSDLRTLINKAGSDE